MSPGTKAFALLILAAALVGGGYYLGYTRAAGACQVAAADEQRQDIKAAEEVATADAEGAGRLEARREQIRTVYRTIEKEVQREVEKPVYRECVLPDGGLREWREANAGEIAAPGPGEPGERVPGAAAVGERDDGATAEEPRGRGEAVPRVQGETEGSGREPAQAE